MLNNLILRKEVVQPTKKPRSVGRHNSKPEKSTSKKKSCLKNKKYRNLSTQLPGEPKSVNIQRYGSAKSRNGKETMIQQRLFSVDGDPKNFSYIDSSDSIPISTYKFVKNCTYINSGTSIPINSKDVIVETSEELKNNFSHYSINCLRLMLDHQV